MPFPPDDLRLAELRHRYANAVQLAASLLMQQSRRCAEPAASRALLDAAGRLGAMHHLHFTLEWPLSSPPPFHTFETLPRVR